jgi:hypothetical protein
MEERKSKEIDIIASILTVLKEWKLLLKFCFVGGVIGVVLRSVHRKNIQLQS